MPEWIRVEAVRDAERVQSYLRRIDRGEAEAIQLAKEIKADRLLIDDQNGRAVAADEGIAIIGLLGVVLLARKQGLIPSARLLLQRLDAEAGAYLAEDLIESALRTIGE